MKNFCFNTICNITQEPQGMQGFNCTCGLIGKLICCDKIQGRIQESYGGIEAKIGRKGANFARFWPILEGVVPPHPPSGSATDNVHCHCQKLLVLKGFCFLTSLQ